MNRPMDTPRLSRMAPGICCAGALLLGLGCYNKSSSSQAADPGTFSAGTYQLSVQLAPAAGAGVPISGVDLTLALPAGVSIAVSNPATGQIDPAALKAGGAVTGTSVVLGTFLAAQKQVHLTLVAAPTASWGGEAFRVTFQTAGTITLKDLQALNSTLPGFRVAGVDTTAHSTVLLTSEVTSSLSILPAS